jgi:hypothetical protein
MGAPDPNLPGPPEPRGQDGPNRSEPMSAQGPAAQAFAGLGVEDPDEARRFAEAQCCSRWPI